MAFGWAEWITWKASRDVLPPGAVGPGRVVPGESVLVLGCPLPVLQRWRVRIAVRSTDPDYARFVFSGGAVRGAVLEAQMMADYAVRELGVPPHNVIVEDQSTTTVENIVNSMPLMTDDQRSRSHRIRSTRAVHARSFAMRRLSWLRVWSERGITSRWSGGRCTRLWWPSRATGIGVLV